MSLRPDRRLLEISVRTEAGEQITTIPLRDDDVAEVEVGYYEDVRELQDRVAEATLTATHSPRWKQIHG